MDHSSENPPHRDSKPPTDQSEYSVVDIAKDSMPDRETTPEREPQEPEIKLERELTKPSLDDFPDGGFQAWLVVVGGFCAVFCGFGWINCE